MVDYFRLRQRVKPGVKFFSERFGGKPYDNCMIDAFMSVMSWIGFNLQDGDDDTIRIATEVPDPKGLSFDDLKTAATTIWPSAGWHIGVADWNYINANIKRFGRRGRYKAMFTIALNMGAMPDEYRHWCGLSYTGGHAVLLVSKDLSGNYYMYDPMQPTDPPTDVNPDEWIPGAWVSKDVLDKAVFKNAKGRIRVAYGFKGGYAGSPYAG